MARRAAQECVKSKGWCLKEAQNRLATDMPVFPGTRACRYGGALISKAQAACCASLLHDRRLRKTPVAATDIWKRRWPRKKISGTESSNCCALLNQNVIAGGWQLVLLAAAIAL